MPYAGIVVLYGNDTIQPKKGKKMTHKIYVKRHSLSGIEIREIELNLTKKQYEKLIEVFSKKFYSAKFSSADPVSSVKRILADGVVGEPPIVAHIYNRSLKIATFPDDLRSLRSRAGLSQAQASAFLKIPKRSIQNWEQGVNCPDSFKIDAVLSVLRSINT